ncbi:MAG: cytochrome C oxidase subunit IV family protein [Bryobacteraceae bacterium]|nr:cytochrome C oxidase subunit IV family protein [Bryobacteraceae bacterium]
MATEAIDTTNAHTHIASDPHHPHGGPKVYATVLGGLLILTMITVGASYIDFGGGTTNVIIAMLIASLKASLVALFFMHLRWDRPLSGIIFVFSLFFLGLFLIGCYGDNASRPPTQPQNLKAIGPGMPSGAPGGQIPPAAGKPSSGVIASPTAAGVAAAPAGQAAAPQTSTPQAPAHK